MNTVKETIIIPTVGLGSRMGEISSYLNKALLPYNNKPILSHIIDAFPDDTRVLIPVGHLSQQIKDYCKLVYSHRDIIFIDVEDWTSDRSGTATTLLACKEHVTGPFWYIPCDTFFSEDILQTKRLCDCFFVEDKQSLTPELYTMFELDDEYSIVSLRFKEDSPESFRAFTGLMYIYEYEKFFKSVYNKQNNEFVFSIQPGSRTAALHSWKDFGNYESYTNETKTTDYDFSKPEEITYVGSKFIIKWWKDPSIANQKYTKTLLTSELYPNDITYAGQFLYYTKVAGNTLYTASDVESKFPKLLTWLNNDVWSRTSDDISASAMAFYKTKSLDRINLFLKNNPELAHPHLVDGVRVNNYTDYLGNIDWDYLATSSIASHIHGDLQFDNIIVDADDKFFLIDWRHAFADQTVIGDLYYDLAKLLGGLIIQYSEIKANNFDVSITDDGSQVSLSVPTTALISKYKYQLQHFASTHDLDFNKIQLMVPIIFWNMSPLHHPPFDLFLWYLGLKLFAELDQGLT